MPGATMADRRPRLLIVDDEGHNRDRLRVTKLLRANVRA
jgi:hypothetical protein